MHFGAHEHSYERNVPVYQYEFDASKMGPEAYVDFNRTVHILSGAAGCPENQDGWQAKGTDAAARAPRALGPRCAAS